MFQESVLVLNTVHFQLMCICTCIHVDPVQGLLVTDNEYTFGMFCSNFNKASAGNGTFSLSVA